MLQIIVAVAVLIFVASAVFQVAVGIVEILHGLALITVGCLLYVLSFPFEAAGRIAKALRTSVL